MKRLALVVVLLLLPLALSQDARAGGHLRIKLKAHASGAFLIGAPPVPIRAPVRFTLHLKHHGKHHVRLVGLGPGRVVHVGIKAKPFKIHVKGLGGPKLKVGPGKVKFKGKSKGKGKHGGLKVKF